MESIVVFGENMKDVTVSETLDGLRVWTQQESLEI